MCILCMISPDLNPLTLGSNGPAFATVTESGDAAAGTNTQYRINVGDTFSGTIDSSSDEDWIAVTLTAGSYYEISLTGTSANPLSDPFLTILDASGFFVASNDDGGAGRNSFLGFTASTSGTYYLEADAYSSQTGTYELTIVAENGPTTPPGLTVGTFEELAGFLMDGGYGWTYTYDTSISNVITVDIRGLTPTGQQLAIWAMQAWEMVADVDFAVRGGGLNQFSGLEMITVDDEESGAFAYFPNAGSTAAGVEVNVAQDWITDYGASIDSYSFQTYVHEFGHALGLHHLGDYNGFANYPYDATFTNDSWQVSVMSYFSQENNISVDASYGLLMGPMIADILAIQSFYGAPAAGSATSGNTTYGLNSNLGNYFDDVFFAMANDTTSANIEGSPIAFTLYDVDGFDTIDLSYLTADIATRIDLSPGTFSDIGDSIGSLSIALGTVIENLLTGAGNDLLSGNDADNMLVAGAGNDVIYGGGGADLIEGGAGDDLIEGGAGDDILWGGGGGQTAAGSGNADVLSGADEVLTGEGLFDVFVFADGGNKVVTDFNLSEADLLVFNLNALGVASGLTGQQIVDTYADASSGTVVLSINGLNLTLEGLSSTAGLGALVFDDSAMA